MHDPRRRLREDRQKVKIATPAEVDTIAASMAYPYAAMILLGAWAALRFGELAALRRRDVDLDRAVVHVERAVVVVRGKQIVGDPKSAAGTRQVAFHTGLVTPLRAHRQVLPDLDDLLFPGVLGGYLRPATFYDAFYPAREAAGRPDLKFHDLRHTGVTALRRAAGRHTRRTDALVRAYHAGRVPPLPAPRPRRRPQPGAIDERRPGERRPDAARPSRLRRVEMTPTLGAGTNPTSPRLRLSSSD